MPRTRKRRSSRTIDGTLQYLNEEGRPTGTFFDVQTLQPPALERMSEQLASDCQVEWYRALADMADLLRSPPPIPQWQRWKRAAQVAQARVRERLPFLLALCLTPRRRTRPLP